MQQILRNHITFGRIEHSVHPASSRSRALDPITTETVVFWKYRLHSLPIGMLQIRLRRAAPHICELSEIDVEFVPPRWLSSFVINYSMKLSWDLIDSHWRWGATLKPLTVNHDPFFINAVWSLDVEGVRASFTTGLASPTDYLAYGNGFIAPWYEVSFVSVFDGDVLEFSTALKT